MRIAMFSDNFYPELSGISDSIMTTGKELARRGHEIAYYAPRYAPRDFRSLNLVDIGDIGPRTSIHRLPSFSYRGGTGQTRAAVPVLASYPSLRRFNPDVIHFHHIFGAGLEAVMESRILHKPLVETNHTPILEFAEYSPIKAAWFKGFLTRYDAWFYNRANFVSSPTRFIFESMRHVNPATPHRSVSNPIDTARFQPMERTTKEKHPFTVLYAGRIAQEKKIDIVIRAAAQARKTIPAIRVIVVGRGSYEDRLRKLTASLGMERAVVFAGFVPEDHLPTYYAKSDLFAIMSTAETQSIVAMQALACEIPVIAADAWGFKEYIIPGIGYLITPDDVNAVAEKIVFLYKNPKERNAMGRKGREHVSQFSIPAVATTWEGIYRDVIKQYNEKNS